MLFIFIRPSKRTDEGFGILFEYRRMIYRVLNMSLFFNMSMCQSYLLIRSIPYNLTYTFNYFHNMKLYSCNVVVNFRNDKKIISRLLIINKIIDKDGFFVNDLQMTFTTGLLYIQYYIISVNI